MSDNNYKVGQVLYIIPTKKPLVVPVCVLEKRISETLEGIVTTYIVKSPKPDSTPVDLSSVSGKVFESLEKVRDSMLQNSRNAIEEMIEKARQASERAFKVKEPIRSAIDQKQEVDENDDPLGFDIQDDNKNLVESIYHSSNIVEARHSDGTLKKVKLEAN